MDFKNGFPTPQSPFGAQFEILSLKRGQFQIEKHSSDIDFTVTLSKDSLFYQIFNLNANCIITLPPTSGENAVSPGTAFALNRMDSNSGFTCALLDADENPLSKIPDSLLNCNQVLSVMWEGTLWIPFI